MKILYAMESPFCFNNGCWFYRNHIPSKALKARGHQVKFIAIGAEIPQQWKEWPDTVVFSRIYARDPLILLREWKQLGKGWFMNWTMICGLLPPTIRLMASGTKQRQYEHFMAEADAVTTTNEYLANKIRSLTRMFYLSEHHRFWMFERRIQTTRTLLSAIQGLPATMPTLTLPPMF